LDAGGATRPLNHALFCIIFSGGDTHLGGEDLTKELWNGAVVCREQNDKKKSQQLKFRNKDGEAEGSRRPRRS
jgi:molecular chaperone DnaK (HSP70)